MTAFVILKRLLAGWLAIVGCLAVARAQTVAAAGTAEVEVRSVKFQTVRAPGGGGAWLETLVELEVRPASGSGEYARFADRVQVALSLSVRRRDGEFDFFRASAEAVSLEAGRASFRFYLPPEILARERVTGDPYAFAVDVAVRGRPAGAVAPFLSTVLRPPEALRSFRDRVVQTAPLNDGVLLPQNDSPFAGSYADDTPTLIRRAR